MNTENSRQREDQGFREEPKNRQEEADKLDRLVRDGEWTELKHNKRYQELTTEGKIVKGLDAVKVREGAINKMYYEELAENPANSSIIYKKSLVPLRNLQKALRARYVGELDPKEAPKEILTVLDIPMSNQSKDRLSLK
jgi:hypothetical protein